MIAELLGSAPCPVLAVPPDAVGRAATRWAPRPRPPSVVCGIDGSDNALKAAEVASDLAGRVGKRLVLVNAYRPGPCPTCAWRSGVPLEQSAA